MSQLTSANPVNLHNRAPDAVAAGDPIRADDFNEVLRTMRERQHIGGGEFTDLPWFALPWRLEILAKNTVRIHPGALIVHAGSVDLTLSGSEEWIYVEHNWGTTSADIRNLSSKPTSTNTILRARLYRLVPLSGVYFVNYRAQWGDIVLASPRAGNIAQ